jgi:N-succinyldiaminopimelate aminotransferase
VVLNSPMNPTGKVFSAEELARIAELVRANDAYAVCDEVYEHMVFDGAAHVPLMTLPGMRERALRIGSAGKTFSLTGWKVGYVTAAPGTLAPVARAHQFLTFTTPPGLQAAVAYGLGKEDSYFAGLAAGLQRRRDLLSAGLERIGFRVARSAGTCFLAADYGPLGFSGGDDDFCRAITVDAGVAAIPFSPFYARPFAGSWIRFAFCKREEVLEEALARLARYVAGPRVGR